MVVHICRVLDRLYYTSSAKLDNTFSDRPNKVVLINFDDGLESQLIYAEPILESHSITHTNLNKLSVMEVWYYFTDEDNSFSAFLLMQGVVDALSATYEKTSLRTVCLSLGDLWHGDYR